MPAPRTKYAKSGDVNIAYQVVGTGPIDLVWVPGWISHLDTFWQIPSYARFLERLASFSRLILFDKRGTGLSDPVPVEQLATLEQRMDDLRAVLDAVGSSRAALFGTSEAGSMCALFAATYPERTTALVLYGAFASWRWDPEQSWGYNEEGWEWLMRRMEESWGDLGGWLQFWAPSVAEDEGMQELWNWQLRMAASPRAAATYGRVMTEIDTRDVLPVIQVPTLVVHRRDDRLVGVRAGRYLAKQIPSAKYVELPGSDHLWMFGDFDVLLDEVQEFLTGVRPLHATDTVLASVLFTDIVDSTKKAAELGDRRWRRVLEDHNNAARRELERFRGREVKMLGDGVLATFDGPGRSIRCAHALRGAVRGLGIQIRAGIHTGECEVMDGDVGGVAVHIGARILGMARPGEVLVSSTVKDLVAGSGIEFEDRGSHQLKGVPGEWRLFAVQGT